MDSLRGQFLVAMPDMGDERFELSDGDIPLGACVTQALQELFARELFATAIALEDLDVGELDRFDRAKALATGDALPPAPDPVVVGAGIGDLGIAEMAICAAHNGST